MAEKYNEAEWLRQMEELRNIARKLGPKVAVSGDNKISLEYNKKDKTLTLTINTGYSPVKTTISLTHAKFIRDWLTDNLPQEEIKKEQDVKIETRPVEEGE